MTFLAEPTASSLASVDRVHFTDLIVYHRYLFHHQARAI